MNVIPKPSRSTRQPASPPHALLMASSPRISQPPRLRSPQVTWLLSDYGVELSVIVEGIFDDLMALVRGVREPRDVEDADFSAGVFDKSFSHKNPGCRRNSGTATPKHVCEKFMRNLEGVGMGAVRTNEQPAGESLFEVVFRIASSGLHCLNELCLNIA